MFIVYIWKKIHFLWDRCHLLYWVTSLWYSGIVL